MDQAERSKTITQGIFIPLGIRELLLEMDAEEVVAKLRADGIHAEIVKEDGLKKIRCGGYSYSVEKIKSAKDRIGIHQHKK